MSPPESGTKDIKLGLAACLKGCAEQDLGTDPENIPSWVQFTLPGPAVASQVASGRITVSLEKIMDGLDGPIRGLFSQAKPGLMVDLPAGLVSQALTENNTPPVFQAPAIMAPARNDGIFGGKPAPMMDAPAATSANPWKEAPAAQPFSPLWGGAALPPGPMTSEPDTGLMAEPAAENAPLFKAVVNQTKKDAVVIPANPLTGAPEFVTPAPVPPSEGSVPAVSTTRKSKAGGNMLLSVLLGTPDVFDVASVARHTRQLPGVSAVLCLNNGKSIAECGDGSAEAQRFLRETPSKVGGLSTLASLTGIEDAETLHIQSGKIEATFCLQGPVTFAVLHDPQRREPMLKEKITLLGRELATMIGGSSGI